MVDSTDQVATSRVKRLAASSNQRIIPLTEENSGPQYSGRVMINLVKPDQLPSGFFKTQQDPLTGQKETAVEDSIDLFSGVDEFTTDMTKVAQKHADIDQPDQTKELLPNKAVILSREKSKELIQKARQGERPEIIDKIDRQFQSVQLANRVRKLKGERQQLEGATDFLNKQKAVASLGAFVFNPEVRPDFEKLGDAFEAATKGFDFSSKEAAAQTSMQSIGATVSLLDGAIDLGTQTVIHAGRDIVSNVEQGLGIFNEEVYRDYKEVNKKQSENIASSLASDDVLNSPSRWWSMAMKDAQKTLEIGSGLQREKAGFLGMGNTLMRELKVLENKSEVGNAVIDLVGGTAGRVGGAIAATLSTGLDSVLNAFGKGDAIDSQKVWENVFDEDNADMMAISTLIGLDPLNAVGAFVSRPARSAKAMRLIQKSVDDLKSADLSAIKSFDDFKAKIGDNIQRNLNQAESLVNFSNPERGPFFGLGAKGKPQKVVNQIGEFIRDELRPVQRAKSTEGNVRQGLRSQDADNLRTALFSGEHATQKVTEGKILAREEKGITGEFTRGEVRQAIDSVSQKLDHSAKIMEEVGIRTGDLPADKNSIKGPIKAFRKFSESLDEAGEITADEFIEQVRQFENPNEFPESVQETMAEVMNRTRQMQQRNWEKIAENLGEVEDLLSPQQRAKLRAMRGRGEIGDEIENVMDSRNFKRKRADGVPSISDKEWQQYKRDFFGKSEERLANATSFEMDSASQATMKFWNDIAKKAGGEGLTDRSFTEMMLRPVIDDTVNTMEARQVKEDFLREMRAGADNIIKHDLTEASVARAKIAKDAIDDIAPFLDKNTRDEFARWASEKLEQADTKYKEGPEKTSFVVSERNEPSTSISPAHPAPPEANLLSDRLKPFSDIVETLKVQGKRMGLTDDQMKKINSLRKSDITESVSDAIKKNSDNLEEKSLVPDNDQLSHIARGIAWNKYQSIDLMDDFDDAISSTIRNQITEDVALPNVAKGYEKQLKAAVATNLGQRGTQKLIDDVVNNIIDSNPKDTEQVFETLRKESWNGRIDSPTAVYNNFRKFVRDDVAGRQPELPDNKPTVAQYVRNGHPEGQTPHFNGGTRQDELFDGFLSNNEGLSKYGVDKATDVRATRQMVEEAVGHDAHLTDEIMQDVENYFAQQDYRTSKPINTTRIVQNHPEFADLFDEIQDAQSLKFVGDMLQGGRVDVVEEIVDSRYWEDGSLNVDEIIKARRGPVGHLPPEEAKSYFSLMNAGMDRANALRVSKRMMQERLRQNMPERLDDIERVAVLRKAKEEFPGASDAIDDLIEGFRNKNFEEYLGADQKPRQLDTVRQQFEEPKQVIDELGDDVPDEVLSRAVENTALDNPEEVYTDWIDQLIKKRSLNKGQVQKYAQDIHGDNLENLDSRQLADVVDFIRASDRVDYTPMRMGFPDEMQLELRKDMGEDYYDPDTWDNGPSSTRIEDKQKPTEGSGDGPPGGTDGGGGGAKDDGVPPDGVPDSGVESKMSWARKAWNKMFSSIKQSMQNLAGEEGNQLSQRILGQKDATKARVGQYNAEIDSIIGFMKQKGIWKKPVWEEMVNALDDPVGKFEDVDSVQEVIDRGKQVAREAAEQSPDEAAQAFEESFQRWREFFDKRADELENSKVKTMTINEDGKVEMRQFSKRENFFPRSFHPDMWESGSKTEKIRRAYEKFMDNADDKTKERIIQQTIESADVHKAGSIDFARFGDTDEYIRDLEKAARLYSHQAARRIEEAKWYGPEMGKIDDLMSKIREKHGHDVADFLQDQTDIALRGWQSRYRSSSEVWNKLTGTLRSILVGTKLTLASIPNLTQWLVGSAIAADDLRSIPRAVKNLMEDPEVPNTGGKSLREVVKQSGWDATQLMRQMMNRMQGGSLFNRLVDFNLKPFKWAESFTRTMAPAVGLENFDILKNRLSELMEDVPRSEWGSNPKIQKIKNRMEEFGIKHGMEFGEETDFPTQKLDVFDIAERGHLNDTERALVMNRYNRKVNFTADQIDLPSSWASPLGKLLTTFKTFSFNWGKLLKDMTFGRLVDGYQKTTEGNLSSTFMDSATKTATGVGALMALGLPLGAVNHNIRSVLSGRDSQLYNDGVSTYLGSVGGLGLMGNLVNSLAWNQSLSEIVGGPVLSEANELFVEPLESQTPEKFLTNWAEFSTQFVPFIGEPAADRIFSSDAEGQTKTMNDVWRNLTNVDELLAVPTSNIPGVESDVGDPQEKGFSSESRTVSQKWIESFKRFLNALYNVGPGKVTGELKTEQQRLGTGQSGISEEKKNQIREKITQQLKSIDSQETQTKPLVPGGGDGSG